MTIEKTKRINQLKIELSNLKYRRATALNQKDVYKLGNQIFRTEIELRQLGYKNI